MSQQRTNLLFDPTGRTLTIPGSPVTVWDVTSRRRLRKLKQSGNRIAIDPSGLTLPATPAAGKS